MMKLPNTLFLSLKLVTFESMMAFKIQYFGVSHSLPVGLEACSLDIQLLQRGHAFRSEPLLQRTPLLTSQ